MCTTTDHESQGCGNTASVAPDNLGVLDHEGEHNTFDNNPVDNPLSNFPFTVTVQIYKLKFDIDLVIKFVESEVVKPENKSISARGL